MLSYLLLQQPDARKVVADPPLLLGDPSRGYVPSRLIHQLPSSPLNNNSVARSLVDGPVVVPTRHHDVLVGPHCAGLLVRPQPCPGRWRTC